MKQQINKPTDADWLRRELEAMTPAELDLLYLRIGRRHRWRSLEGKAVTMIDPQGDRYDPANLRIVDIRENRRHK